MINIENTYVKYDELLDAVGGEKIVQSRIE